MTDTTRSVTRSVLICVAGGLAGFGVGQVTRTTPVGDVLPGITREVVCDKGYAKRTRDVPESEKAEVFRRAGVAPADRHLYEVDHVVPLALGGSNRIENLSPQLWDGPDGAHAKDRLEYLCYTKVCKGELTLAEAQSIFRGDWRAAYRKYGLDRAKLGTIDAAPDHDTEGFPR